MWEDHEAGGGGRRVAKAKGASSVRSIYPFAEETNQLPFAEYDCRQGLALVYPPIKFHGHYAQTRFPDEDEDEVAVM